MIKESKVGERIRMYRERLEMSIADLSAKSGIGEDIVKSVEAGEVIPALGVLTRLARALGQRLGTFMDDQFKPDPIITRAADLEAARVAGEGMNEFGYASHSLAIGTDGSDVGESSHEGEELIICLAGEVELTYGGEKTILKAGDTAYYNSVVKHSLKAVGGKPASIYGIVFMPF